MLSLGKLKTITLPPTHSMNIISLDKMMFSKLGPAAAILDLGSGRRRLKDKVINLDITAYPTVDIVGSGEKLPFQDESFDCVIVTAVLEHVPNPRKVVDETMRVLRQGG